MKKLAFLLCMLALLLPVQALADGSDLDITLVGQSPYPAEPGGAIDLDIQIQNSGHGDAENIVVEIRPESPLSLLDPGDKTKSFTQIGSGSSVKTTYKLHVNDSVISGSYDLEFYVYYNNNPSLGDTQNVAVKVEGEPKLVLGDVEMNPESAGPGDMVDMKVTIKNVGSGKASYAEFGLNSSSEYIIPVLAGGSVYVGDIEAGSEKALYFKISIDSSSEYKTYVTSITANYKDEDLGDQEVVFDIGIPVQGSIVLDVINTEANYARERLRIEVANKGTSEAKSLEAKLMVDGEAVGIDYLTNLKANKQTTFDFPLVYQGTGQLVIDYIGPGTEKNQVTEVIVLNFQRQGGDGSGTLILVAVVVIVILIYLAWKRKLPFLSKKSKL